MMVPRHFSWRVRKGHAEVVSLLLGKEGVDVNQATNDGATPLFIASQKGHAEVVSLLLGKEGVDVNQATNNGTTPLYIASQEGHADVVSAAGQGRRRCESGHE